MDEEQNHYKVLGVDKNADTEKIKQAYRTAARKYHPDTGAGNSDTFRRVQQAYEVLSDQDQRTVYDRSRDDAGLRTGHRRPANQYGNPVYPRRHGNLRSATYSPGRSFVDELFNRFFSGLSARRPVSYGSYGRELAVDLILSSNEAKRGGRVAVELPVTAQCPDCGGWGCLLCRGSGEIETSWGVAMDIPPGVTNGSEEYISLGEPGLPGFVLQVTILVESDG